MTAPVFTYGDLLSVGFLLDEFNNNPTDALRWCESFPGALSEAAVLLLREAEKRKSYHHVLKKAKK